MDSKLHICGIFELRMQLRKGLLIQISNKQLYIFFILLAVPALLYNLDITAFIGDEGIRTLVALEMKWSGNYLLPTLNAQPFYNKPPLYNWIILLTSTAWGSFGEWPTRLTNLFFLACFSASIYFFIRKHFDTLFSMSITLMFITCGRILFWDSMFGLIDICFSWVVFVNFMILYRTSEKNNWILLFIYSYLLCSVGFLLKGMPALVFQAISISVTLWLNGAIRSKLLSFDHILGVVVGLLPLYIYYFLYSQQVSLQHAFMILWDQSIQRTATHHGLEKMILHLFTFPLEFVYHFLPWSLLFIVLFHPNCFRWIRTHPFVRFNFWMALANLPVYWLSVQVYPRYLFMFVPLLLVVCYYVLIKSLESGMRWWRYLHIAFSVLTIIACLIIVIMPLLTPEVQLPYFSFFWLGGSLFMLLTTLAITGDSKRMILWLGIALLTVRIVFNGVITPLRNITDKSLRCKYDCSRLANLYGNKTWYIFDSTETHQVARFYTSNFCQRLIRKTRNVEDKNAYYLVDTEKYPRFMGYKRDSLYLETGEVIELMEIVK